MVDNLKKKKLDSKRVSLNQKHEVAYLKEIAEGFLGYLNKFSKQKRIMTVKAPVPVDTFSVSKARKICKALLKCIKLIKDKRLLK